MPSACTSSCSAAGSTMQSSSTNTTKRPREDSTPAFLATPGPEFFWRTTLAPMVEWKGATMASRGVALPSSTTTTSRGHGRLAASIDARHRWRSPARLRVGITTLTSGEGESSGIAVPEAAGQLLDVAAVGCGDVVDAPVLEAGQTLFRVSCSSDVPRNLARSVAQQAERETRYRRGWEHAAVRWPANLAQAAGEANERDQRRGEGIPDPSRPAPAGAERRCVDATRVELRPQRGSPAREVDVRDAGARLEVEAMPLTGEAVVKNGLGLEHLAELVTEGEQGVSLVAAVVAE